MTSPTQEHLLGYLLGALEPTENEQLEHAIASDPQLAKQLDQIARCLQPLESCRHQEGPPHGLAARTCNHIFAEVAEPVAPARQGVAAAMSPEYGGSDGASSWRLADFVVAAGVFISAGMLFFPAIANSRFMSRRAACENNLRQFAHNMIEDAYRSPRQEFYPIDKSGALSFAGMTAVGLHDRQYLPNPEVLICPNSPLAMQRGKWFIPTRKQLEEATPSELAELQRQAGGSLALPLGYEDGDEYTLGRNLSRETRVLAADAPSGAVPQLLSLHHEGKGQNVAFESGRTQFISGCGESVCGDAMYMDHDNRIHCGKNEDDNVVANSHMPPFPELLPLRNQH